ncbi:hypothetical protein SLNWT_2658 [Streptomyces albus]|uniref:DUF4232 domain-containing protein n=1 Tax=Streptomyces albus (strain ATCC 21838 / DSM 41398 / FERM P-419 / JCM 4703 / NBRC 107858) TaxID=1081613 RepID=A0A0B5EN49_STRA4|nr:hypothetical protein SLNWT_2658 [Streptomyces albus]AOU77344.1 hypothetical protein SLNHY_2653 [Streptomyces albus]AYN33120.1 DUF4232 domain-containing protein [Streptomyces albus]
MRKNLIRTTALAVTAVAAVFSLTACDGDEDSSSSSSPGAEQSADKGQGGDSGADGSGAGSGSQGASAGSESGGSSGGASGGDGSSDAGGSGGGGGDKDGYGQVCGANDLTWKATSKTQAGGYTLLSVQARSGITCTLPAQLPVVAFGSDGTEAGPAEQSVGEPVKLSGGTVAYAGVNPKTTNRDGGKELEEIIVAVSKDDRTDPVALKTGTLTVDDPIVTNWHTSPADAVPFDGGH